MALYSTKHRRERVLVDRPDQGPDAAKLDPQTRAVEARRDKGSCPCMAQTVCLQLASSAHLDLSRML
jgi:hypothetical protein